MLRKQALIPTDSPLGTLYLENIAVHREIQAMIVAQSGK